MKLIPIIVALTLISSPVLAKQVTNEIKVKGMTCGSCAVAVEKALTGSKGVRSADVNLKSGVATVIYDNSEITEKQLLEVIHKAGFATEPAMAKSH